MTRLMKSILLMGSAVLALSACSGGGKGPGALGSKNDIIVRNNGLPQSQGQPAPLPPSSAGDFSSTVEAAKAVPAPTVESVPPTDPAVDQAAQQLNDARSPVPSTTATPMADETPSTPAPTTQTTAADIVAAEPVSSAETLQPAAPQPAAPASVTPPVPQEMAVATPVHTPAPALPSAEPLVPAGTPVEPMTQSVIVPKLATAPEPVRRSSVYPEEDFPQVPESSEVASFATPMTEPAAEAAMAPAHMQTPVQQPVVQDVPPPLATPMNLSDPITVKMAQAALRLKGVYTGPENGVMDTEFLNALSKYQGDNKLPQGGINEPTLRHLGVMQ